ncbi:helix-turn-helix domain-containing protein [Streptomyces hokutonensis]|uniref:helix-turn-helix domain-containing protein n=1 Tax=Streptomyces hokutonensis TaxID=1306990 RepID=UPI0036BCF377
MNQLVSSLRELKARTGLSLAGLAARTPYSKSSWERYLNGKTLPPREAVEELCRLAGEPVGRYVALWEIAEAEASGRGASEGGTPTVPPPPPPSPSPSPDGTEVTESSHRWGVAALAVLGSVCAVAVGGVAVALLLLPHHSAASSSTPPSSSGVADGSGCREAGCEGRSPMTMRCAGRPDTLVTRRTATGAWLQLRHSSECGTTWARMWGGRIGDRIEFAVPGRAGSGYAAEVGNAVEADTYVYTMMAVTAPGTAVRACFLPAGTDTGKRECFDGRVT